MDHNQGVEIYSPGYFHNQGGAKSENDFLKAAPRLWKMSQQCRAPWHLGETS